MTVIITEHGSEVQRMSDNPHSKDYASIKDIPTDVLASRFVGSLILCKGNLNQYKDRTAYLIRELRGEPHPKPVESSPPASDEPSATR